MSSDFQSKSLDNVKECGRDGLPTRMSYRRLDNDVRVVKVIVKGR